MKKRMFLLLCAVLLGSVGWQSGWVVTALQNMGRWAALCAVSRSPFPMKTVWLETGQGYEEGLFVTPVSTESESSSAPVVNLSINNGKYAVTNNIAVKNGTSKSVDVSTLLKEGFQKPKISDGPAVLIYHTHTTESYIDAGKEYSTDTERGVVGVGKAMKEVFESHGLKTVHLTDNFIDGGSFKKAYTRSLDGVQAVLKQYPSIRLVLDIHRDSITEGGTEYCPLTVLDGKEYAQIMVISGTNELGLSHSGWRDNLKYALALVERLQQDYPGLSRPLNLNANRYNTHTTPYALLIEVGGGANTSSQAKRSGRAVAESICNIIS
ncbi:MAG: stage II sporulation protein P [Clostridia bacterium]|nr:stage II sporulation protein P [Clostridia bacterium]